MTYCVCFQPEQPSTRVALRSMARVPSLLCLLAFDWRMVSSSLRCKRNATSIPMFLKTCVADNTVTQNIVTEGCWKFSIFSADAAVQLIPFLWFTYACQASKQSSQLFARKIYSALCISTIKEDARVFVLVNQNSKKIPYLVFESSFSLSIMIRIPLSMNCFANKNTVHTGPKNISLYWTKTLSFHYLRHKRH